MSDVWQMCIVAERSDFFFQEEAGIRYYKVTGVQTCALRIYVTPAELDAFRRREPGAVRALYRGYGRLVYAVAYRVLGRRDLAEDAVQETFVRAWQAAGTDRKSVV